MDRHQWISAAEAKSRFASTCDTALKCELEMIERCMSAALYARAGRLIHKYESVGEDYEIMECREVKDFEELKPDFWVCLQRHRLSNWQRGFEADFVEGTFAFISEKIVDRSSEYEEFIAYDVQFRSDGLPGAVNRPGRKPEEDWDSIKDFVSEGDIVDARGNYNRQKARLVFYSYPKRDLSVYDDSTFDRNVGKPLRDRIKRSRQ